MIRDFVFAVGFTIFGTILSGIALSANTNSQMASILGLALVQFFAALLNALSVKKKFYELLERKKEAQQKAEEAFWLRAQSLCQRQRDVHQEERN